jgi:hypothetical protein
MTVAIYFNLECSKCGATLAGQASVGAFIGDHGNMIQVEPCPVCIPHPQIHVDFISNLPTDVDMEIVYHKKNGQIRDMEGKFCVSDDHRPGYVWFYDKHDDQVKSLIAKRIEKISHSGQTFEVTGGLYG